MNQLPLMKIAFALKIQNRIILCSEDHHILVFPDSCSKQKAKTMIESSWLPIILTNEQHTFLTLSRSLDETTCEFAKDDDDLWKELHVMSDELIEQFHSFVQ